MYLTNWLLYFIFVVTRSVCSTTVRIMRGSADSYCTQPVLRQIAGISPLECAKECLSDAECVAYSVQRGSTCLLHDDFCGAADLLADQGSHYGEVKLECQGSSCYYMPTLRTPKTKSDADAVCEAMGAHVVATETQEENDFIHHLYYQSAYYPTAGHNEETRAWIDLVDDVTWHHSGEKVNFTNWESAREGDPGNREFCTCMVDNGAWTDVFCSREYAFICEL